MEIFRRNSVILLGGIQGIQEYGIEESGDPGSRVTIVTYRG